MTPPRRVLVVEDERVVAMDLATTLNAMGYETLGPVDTGEEALRVVARDRPDLVLMDIRLKGQLDGIETARQVQQEHDLPVVYLTAHSDTATLKRAQETGPLGYLLKPFDERELQIVVEMAIHRHQAQKEHERLLQERAERAFLERESQWARFLADTSARLSASLDLSRTLDVVTRLAVPQLADWAGLHIQDESGVRTSAVYHRGGREDLVHDFLREFDPGPNVPHGFARVLRTGEPELIPDITDDVITRVVSDETQRNRLRGLALRSTLCVPLIMRGQVYGALTLAVGESGRRYGQDDLARSMEFARRCAPAVDNARLYQTARQAVAMREEFLSVAAHELRTPLSTVQLALYTVQRLAQRENVSEKILGKIADLERQLGRVNELIDRLFDISRIVSGLLHLTPAPFDLAELVREVAGRFDPSARDAGSTLSTDVPQRLPFTGDRSRMDQVLTNLLGNAVKFGAGKPITVALASSGSQIKLLVEDQGIGIAPSELPYVFDRFARGVSVRNYAGLGLGLYLARQIVEAHHGSITVESEPQRGARFTVTLPVPPDATP